ncbi:MAG TPA: Asp-tRNA(Asn)/Glu-tRNA(Gln) amidotransferase subunit GatC [Calidithermus sp.]|nr:Asp-tRNA(Asn)/Glu-tRNA(Gln) amidotransferase subunit GatC [Calidithermus sp.]
MIEDRDVEHVARLARLTLSPADRERLRRQLGAILEYIAKLEALDVTGVEPTSHAVLVVNVMREDEVRPGLGAEEALANAPDRRDHFFRVPRILED